MAMFPRRLLIVAASGGLVVFAAWLYLRPAWESEARIRNGLLEVTPLGSNMSDVRSLAESRGWIQPHVQSESYMGFSTEAGIDLAAFSGQLRQDPFPYRTAVSATWEFNQSNKLVNIKVLRHE